MNPIRAATPLSVAAHSLYEQSDPMTVYEPDGVLRVDDASYEAVNERMTRVRGATWEQANQLTVKIEGVCNGLVNARFSVQDRATHASSRTLP